MCARWSPVLLSGDGHTSVRGRREAPRDSPTPTSSSSEWDAEVVDVDEEPAERTAVLVDTVAPLWASLQPHDRVRALVATGGTN